MPCGRTERGEEEDRGRESGGSGWTNNVRVHARKPTKHDQGRATCKRDKGTDI